MKKTLALFFSFSALAIPALGEEPVTFKTADLTLSGNIDSITEINKTMTWTTSGADAIGSPVSSYMLTFTFDGFGNSTKKDGAMFTVSRNNSGGSIGLGLAFDYDTTTATGTFNLSYNTDASTIVDLSTETLDLTAGHTYAFAYDSTTNTVYLADTSTKKAVSHTLTDTSYTITALTSGASSLWTQGARVHMTIGTLTDMSVVNGSSASFLASVKAGQGMSIPEPATASLSLLALAGLAARRRRR